MGTELEDRYLDALEHVNLADLARDSGLAYRTLQAYRRGERRITRAAARALVAYLRHRAHTLTAACDELAAALIAEEEG